MITVFVDIVSNARLPIWFKMFITNLVAIAYWSFDGTSADNGDDAGASATDTNR